MVASNVIPIGSCSVKITGTNGLVANHNYCYKDSTVFVHLLKDYSGNTFTMPPLGKLRIKKIYDVYAGKPLSFAGDSSVIIRDFDRTASPADTVIGVEYKTYGQNR